MPDGVTFVVLKSGADTNGQQLDTEMTFPAGTAAPPPHRHPNQEEDYKVLQGSLKMLLGDRWLTLAEGEEITIPKNTLHWAKNENDSPTVVLNSHRPVLDFEHHMGQVHELVQAGKIKGLKHPATAIYTGMLWHAHRRDLVFKNPLLRFGVATLAGIGKILRFRIPD